jgi:hypothetical protein
MRGVLTVKQMPGNEVYLVIDGDGLRLVIALDNPMIVGFDILRKAANYEPPASWKLADETDCRILETNNGEVSHV